MNTMSKKVWSKQEIKKLIERYKENPILWSTPSVDNTYLVKKRLIQEKLSAEFDTTVTEIGRKMRILRAQWLKEYKNMKKYAADFGADYAYESKWIWFKPLMPIIGLGQSNNESFIDTSNINTITEDKQKDNEDQNDDDTYLHIKEDASCADDDDKYSTLRECDENSTEVEFKDGSCDSENDEYQIFGNYVANELRSMHYEKNVRELKRLIQQHIIQWTEEDDKEYYST